jgi:hypothetical protein
MEFQQTDNGRICKTFKDDCVVRSISVATGKTYRDTFEDLMKLGLQMGAYPNHEKVWVKYLEQNGFVKNKPPRNAKGKYIKLQDWDFDGVAVVINSGHLTAVQGGVCIDSWDCRYRPVNSYWTAA